MWPEINPRSQLVTHDKLKFVGQRVHVYHNRTSAS